MSYLLWLPGVRGGNAHSLAAMGLQSLLSDGDRATFTDIATGGPDKAGPGCLVTFGDPMLASIAYQPATQHWEPCKPGDDGRQAGAFWMGRELSHLVTPEAIQRARVFRGMPVKMGDGQMWTIPIARFLPHSMGLGSDGKFARKADPQFVAFCERSKWLYASLVANNDGISEIHLPGYWSYIVESLAINYALNADVVDFLDLVKDDCFIAALGATIELDWIAAVEAQKKTAD